MTQQRWEHAVEYLFAGDVERQVREVLGRNQEDGWELVAIYEGLMIFKRPMEVSF